MAEGNGGGVGVEEISAGGVGGEKIGPRGEVGGGLDDVSAVGAACDLEAGELVGATEQGELRRGGRGAGLENELGVNAVSGRADGVVGDGVSGEAGDGEVAGKRLLPAGRV